MANEFYVNQKDYVEKLNKLWERATLSLTGTSTNSLTIGVGSKSLTVEPDRQFSANQSIAITSTASTSNAMIGTVTSYNATTGALVVNVTSVLGAGTFAAWTVALQGVQGAAGTSITGATIDGSGHLILTLSTGATIDAGVAKGTNGTNGSNGVSITNLTVNGSGNLIVTLSNGSTVDAGHVVGSQGVKGDQGNAGPANSLSIGTVTSGASPSATITGTAPTQTLNLVLPKGDTGPTNTLSIGTVTTGTAGSSAAATITGTAPSQVLNLTLPRGSDGTGTVNSVNGVAGVSGNVTLTKSDIGLGNVDNTSDANKPISTAVQNALNLKTTDSTLATVAKTGAYSDLTGKPTIPTQYTDTMTRAAISVTGSLSYDSSTGVISYTAPTLATVASTGSYTDLTNKPTIPTNNTQLTNGAGYQVASDVSTAITNERTATATLTNKTLSAPVVNGYTEATNNPATGSSFTIDLTKTVSGFTTNANATITLPAPVAGKSFQVQIDYGGAHSLTWSVTGGSTIRWPANTAPTPTSASGKTDIFNFVCDVHGLAWIGSTFGQNYTT